METKDMALRRAVNVLTAVASETADLKAKNRCRVTAAMLKLTLDSPMQPAIAWAYIDHEGQPEHVEWGGNPPNDEGVVLLYAGDPPVAASVIWQRLAGMIKEYGEICWSDGREDVEHSVRQITAFHQVQAFAGAALGMVETERH